MSKFTFSLAERRPELFKNCQLPTASSVPVSYEGKLLCDITIPVSGVIDLPVPESLRARLKDNRVMIMIDTASLLPHDALDDFQMVRIVAIDMFDRN